MALVAVAPISPRHRKRGYRAAGRRSREERRGQPARRYSGARRGSLHAWATGQASKCTYLHILTNHSIPCEICVEKNIDPIDMR